jgi:flagellar protein FlgJ
MDAIQNNTPAGPGKPFMNLKQPELKPLRGKVVHGPGQQGDEAAQLRKTARDFESIFMAQVLKGMRETVQKEDMFHGGPGEDLFEGMLDEEIAKRMAMQGSVGIGEMLYRDLSRRFHIGQEDKAQGAKGTVDPQIKKFLPLHPPSGGPTNRPLSPADAQGRFMPLRPDAKTDLAASQAPSSAGRAADVEAQIRSLKQQAQEIRGTTLRK